MIRRKLVATLLLAGLVTGLAGCAKPELPPRIWQQIADRAGD